jgi:uncharacterized protein (DUF1330 family)
VPNEDKPDLSLFLDILHILERIGAPYMIIGGFAATMYGITRTTYDIDIVVDLKEQHIQALVAAYPSPRYYADPEQMRNSIRMGISFNIIDGKRGEKADLSPLTRDSRYRDAFGRRIRQRITWPGVAPFDAWCARPDDVIYGKLLAWDEGRSHKHESDIYDMLVFRALEADPTLAATFDAAYLDAQAQALGPDVVEFWESVKAAARREVGHDEPLAAC